MSYQVLARKWRPKSFREMVGQEHVLTALINALDHGRLHHAYLFTGTRGVGKTTIARILAKSLNCETGISSEPCGQCSACQEINDGRFVDLIEVDAASRTKVEDTRELLENVQYAPTRGRFKVYLIDEVHMLSGHSFNALLKTLEEPPPHVKFLLATTDPQKMPVTILSRCLQFSLKAMTPERIVAHLKKVLEAEMVEADDPALWLLGRAADGSMRDALSLTDQAIAFGNGKVAEAEVRAMLGSIDREFVFALVEALAQENAEALLKAIANMAEQSPDYSAVLAELVSTLHRLAVAQLVPDAVDDSEGDRERILEFSKQFAAETLQLFYQTGLLGRRDLPLAPDVRSGFEMILLRMLLFRPQVAAARGQGANSAGKPVSPVSAGQASERQPPAQALGSGGDHLSRMREALGEKPAPSKPKQVPVAPDTMATPPGSAIKPGSSIEPKDEVQASAPERVTSVPPASVPLASVPVTPASSSSAPAEEPERQAQSAAIEEKSQQPAQKKKVIKLGDEWADLVGILQLDGPVRNFARNCTLEDRQDQHWTLAISPRFEALYKDENRQLLEQAISEKQGNAITLKVSVAEQSRPTPDQLLAKYKQERQQQAVELMQQDPFVQALQTRFGATLDLKSVTPVDEG